MIHRIPYRAEQDLSASALRGPGQLPGITGVKYATDGITGETVDPWPTCRTTLAVPAGDDASFSPCRPRARPTVVPEPAESAHAADAHLCF